MLRNPHFSTAWWTRAILAGAVVCAFSWSSVHADVDPRPVSARVFGMGGMFAAVANDWNALFYNPAGLGQVRQVEVAGAAGRALTGPGSPQSEFYAAGASPLSEYRSGWNFGTVAGALHRTARRNDSTVTNVILGWGLNAVQSLPARLGNFRIPANVLAGGALHIRKIESSSPFSHPDGFGGGLDAGVIYRLGEGGDFSKGWVAGFAIQEINMPSIASPITYRLGAAWRSPRLVYGMDWVVEDGVTRFFPGMEYAFFNQLLWVRAGTGHVPGKARQATIGLGVVLPPIQADVAYGFPLGEPLESNDRIVFSLTYRFGAPLLSQFFNQDKSAQTTDSENRAANLQAQKEAMEIAVREQRSIFEKAQAGLRETQAKTVEAEKNLKAINDKLELQRKELDHVGQTVKDLSIAAGDLEKKIEQQKAEYRDLQVRPPGSKGGARKHRVTEGDTLRSIAKIYYGDPDLWKVIYDANSEKITRGAPKIGEELNIP